ncbi:MAG: MGMT family protein [Kofleriaceae bacterium]
MPSKGRDEAPRLAALYARILAVVRRVPRGRVVTYGQAAELAGLPGRARVAAAALKVGGGSVPWQRVLGKRGGLARIAILDPIGAATQRALLAREGVTVDERGLVRLAEFGWIRSTTRPGRAALARRHSKDRPPRRAALARRHSKSRLPRRAAPARGHLRSQRHQAAPHRLDHGLGPGRRGELRHHAVDVELGGVVC